MENINFRGIPTSLFLNGPKVGIVTDPQDQVEVIGFATFTGIATATEAASLGVVGSLVLSFFQNSLKLI